MSKKLKIYFTSDVHGYIYPTTYGDNIIKNVGLLSCASMFEKDENTLVIDGGDNLQGSALTFFSAKEEGSPEVLADMMNDFGYDYVTIGNHDFNYGISYQRKYLNRLNAKCVCQNVTDEDGNILYPYDIKTMPNGLKVGIVGIVTDFVNVWEKKEHLEGVKVADTFSAVKEAFMNMKSECDVTVCIYHGGFECDLDTGKSTSKTTENVGYRICKELDFDILLTGHQHMSLDGRELFGTYVVQPFDQAKEYHLINLIFDNGKKSITSEKIKADSKSIDSILYDKYMPFEKKVQEWLNVPVGHLSHELMPKDKLEMALNGSDIAEFFLRVQKYYSGSDISVVGLANEIAGFTKEVTTRNIISTYPYPNTLAVVKINGSQLRKVMERSAEYFSINSDGEVVISDSFIIPKLEHYNYDYYSGVEYTINPRKPVGERIENLTFNGLAVKNTDVFTLSLNNYRLSGAGGYEVYTECPLVKEINTEMVELLIDYFRENPYVEL